MSYHRLTSMACPPELIGFGNGSMVKSEDTGESFPKPQRRDGKDPCGECRLPIGETCDICGAVA